MDRTSNVPVEIGSIVAGKYRIERTLAEGGMGVVVAATHLHLDQCVALKFLRGDVSAELDALARFTREAKAAAQLRSEYVARVIDAGVTEDGTPYMAMEYLEGESLAATLQTRGHLDVPSAVEYVIQACEGLSEAHSRGIVHRDIKPYNLFLVERAPGWNAIKILDFGISKVAFADGGNILTGVIVGSPCYMSPEQLRSTANVDQRTDIWSLGATLYELLVGRAAFDAAQTLPELITAILHEPAPRASDARPEIPAELSAVIDRCLAKEREDRFNTGGELAAALLPFANARAHVAAERAASMRPAFKTEPPGPADERRRTPRPLPPSRPPAAPYEVAGGTGVIPTSLTVQTNSLRAEEAQRPGLGSPSRAWLPISSGAVAAAIVLGGLWLATANRHLDASTARPVDSSPPVSAARDILPAASLAALPTLPERVQLVVRASPSGARITIDDKPVDNPFVASYPRDWSMHRVVARAWGYQTKSSEVSFGSDVILDLGLERQVLYTAPVASSAASAAVTSAPPAQTQPVQSTAAETRPRHLVPSSTASLDPAGGHSPVHPIETRDPYHEP